MKSEEIDQAGDEMTRAVENANKVRNNPGEYTPETVEAVRAAWPILWRLNAFNDEVGQMIVDMEKGKPVDYKLYDIKQGVILNMLSCFHRKQFFGLNNFVNIRKTNKNKREQ